jgi:hypothetical protein
MSLVGLLVVVVVLGALMVSAIVGLKSSLNGDSTAGPAASAVAASNVAGRMSESGSPNIAGIPAGLACPASVAAAQSSSKLYYATHGNSYPSQWTDMTASASPLFTLPKGVTVNGSNPRELVGPGWQMKMSGGGSRPPTFVCS